MKVYFNLGHQSDLGRERQVQEDAYACQPLDLSPGQRKGVLFIVADGVGGRQAGEIASQMAVKTIMQTYYADPGDEPSAAIYKAFQAANNAIYRAAQAPGREKMATTAVCTIVRNGELIVANAGDSRAYLMRDGRLEQITNDHSWVAEQVAAGILTEDEAVNHPNRNVITRSLGNKPDVEPEIQSIGQLRTGDILMLCTDGLYEGVPLHVMQEVLSNNPPPISCQKLIDLANQAGGSDNITVVVAEVKVEGVDAASVDKGEQAERREDSTGNHLVKPVPAVLEIAAPVVTDGSSQATVVPSPVNAGHMEVNRAVESFPVMPEQTQLHYVDRQNLEAIQEEQLSLRQKNLIERARLLDEQEHTLREREKDLAVRQSGMEAIDRKVNALENDLRQRAQLLSEKHLSLKKVEKDQELREAALKQRQEQLDALEAKPQPGGIIPEDGNWCYFAECEIHYRASGIKYKAEINETLHLPERAPIRCGLLVEHTYFMPDTNYPSAIRVWAKSGEGESRRMLVGYGLLAEKLLEPLQEENEYVILTRGDEMINLRFGDTLILAQVTQCEFAHPIDHGVSHERTAFAGMTVKFFGFHRPSSINQEK
ncbi:MAG TPA: Stp1/IreP family PP2C-type Ser/Thr phosphatase [Anaerolineaceae bacterium]